MVVIGGRIGCSKVEGREGGRERLHRTEIFVCPQSIPFISFIDVVLLTGLQLIHNLAY